MKVTTVVGARPQFIKAAVVSDALAARGIRESLIHTGQHYDTAMSKIFFDQLGIRPPEHHMEIGSGRHGEQTGRMLTALERVLSEQRPDAVLVYGDTNSTLAGGLAAAKLNIPVAHVEAGLRSFNRRMPEEINRVVVDHLSELLFAPTDTAAENLRREGMSAQRIVQVGDVMLDAALRFVAIAEAQGIVPERWRLTAGDYVLATVHRAENADDPARLNAIFAGLAKVARDRQVVLPLHPRTRKALGKATLDAYGDSIELIEPVGYLEMLILEKNAGVIATDSGGVQKEAFFFGVPCVTMRDETEWEETVEHGGNVVAPPRSADTVATAIVDALKQPARPRGEAGAMPFGTGDSAARISQRLLDGM